MSLPWTSSMSWTEACNNGHPWDWPWAPQFPPAPQYYGQNTFTLTTIGTPTKDALIDQALALLELVSGKEEQHAKLLEVAANLLKVVRQL